MKKPALLFYGDTEKAGLYRTFSHMNPKLYIEVERVKNTVKDRQKAMSDALLQISTQFGPRKVDESITEVSSLLPDTFDITIGELKTSKTYPEKEVSVNGFRFRIWQESTTVGNFGGKSSLCKIQPIFERSTPFLLPDELEAIDDTKDMLNNRAGKNFWTSNHERLSIREDEKVREWLQKMFLDYKILALGHTFESLAKDTSLRRNYGFLVWLILHYNKSSQK